MGCKKCAENDRTILEQELFDLWATGKYDDWVSPDWSEAKEPFTKWAIANLPQFAPLGEKNAESNVRTFVVSSVDYETDGQEDLDLPQDFTFVLDVDGGVYDIGDTKDMQEIADQIVDDISDETGWLVSGFYFQEKMPDGTLVDLNAEESAVQEPDWIPAGEGRAIGQQNFGINLSPLHAESFAADGLKAFAKKIENEKNKLIRKAKRSGLYENFGEKESRKLRDSIAHIDYYEEEEYRKLILVFDEWCQNYWGAESFNAETMAVLQKWGHWVCMNCGSEYETESEAIECAEQDGGVLEGFEQTRKQMIKLYGAESFNAEQSESVLKKLRQTYDMYESTNQHTSNYLLLATFFGTDAEKEKVKKLIAKKNRKGGLTQADNQWLYKNINPYYDNLRNVKNAESFSAETNFDCIVCDSDLEDIVKGNEEGSWITCQGDYAGDENACGRFFCSNHSNREDFKCPKCGGYEDRLTGTYRDFEAEESWGFVVVDGKGLRTDAFRTKEQARFYTQKLRDEAGRKGVRVVKAKKSDDRMNKAQMDLIFGKGWDAETFNAEESWGFVVVDGKGLRTDAFRTKEQARFYTQKLRDEAGRKGVRVVKAKKSDDRMNKAQMDIIFGKGWDAETTGSPSPTFNENITGQDGPSETPTNSNFSAETRPYKFRSHANTYHLLTDDGKATRCGMSGMSIRFMQDYGGVGDRTLCGACNPESKSAETQTFEAMRTLAPSTRDVDSARRQLKNSGYGEVIYDRYIVNQQGSSNKFYYTAITEKDGKYYPMGAYGRIGYFSTLFNVAGKKERPMAHFGSMEEAYSQIRGKEVSKINARKPEKRYVDYTLRRDAESLAQIEGPIAEATTGGLHSPSSFAMTWEDGTGQSSASIPPNEIAWAETSGIPLWIKVGAGIALVLAGKKLVSSRSSAQKAENNLKSAVKARKGCCGSSKTVRKDSEFSVGQINPVEVEGQSDVYGAEELHSPQTSAKVSQPNWGPQTTYLQNQRSNQKMW